MPSKMLYLDDDVDEFITQTVNSGEHKNASRLVNVAVHEYMLNQIDHVRERIKALKRDMKMARQRETDLTTIDRIKMEQAEPKAQYIASRLDYFYKTYKIKKDRGDSDSMITNWFTGPGTVEDAQQIDMDSIDVLLYCERRYAKEAGAEPAGEVSGEDANPCPKCHTPMDDAGPDWWWCPACRDHRDRAARMWG